MGSGKGGTAPPPIQSNRDDDGMNAMIMAMLASQAAGARMPSAPQPPTAPEMVKPEDVTPSENIIDFAAKEADLRRRMKADYAQRAAASTGRRDTIHASLLDEEDNYGFTQGAR